MSDNELIDLITDNGRLKYVSLRYINKLKENNINLYNEIINRYADADSIKEILYRLKNNIEIRPVCKNCGGHILFINDKGNRHWQEYCSQKCLHDCKQHWDKCKETCKEKYGEENFRNIEKAKQTKLEKYGDENYINVNKSRETRLQKYGEWNSENANNVFKNLSTEERKLNVQKSKKTKLKRYGNENYVNKEKYKETCLAKYGVDHNFKTKESQEKRKNTFIKKYGYEYPTQSDIVKEKTKQTCLEKYGVEYSVQSDIVKEKIKQTCLEKYGVENILNLDSVRDTHICHSKESRNKAIKTSYKRFGKENYNNREKTKLTCLERYGVTNKRKLQESRDHMSIIMSSKEIQDKRNNTLKSNNSFNKSEPEETSYNLIKQKYPDVIRQYKSDVYPFACDFYIPSLNLYIECNYHWTHGGHPYDSNNIDDYNKLQLWESKTSHFYRNAIITWTCRDVNKRQVAIQNNLNYKEFFSILELNKWLSDYAI